MRLHLDPYCAVPAPRERRREADIFAARLANRLRRERRARWLRLRAALFGRRKLRPRAAPAPQPPVMAT